MTRETKGRQYRSFCSVLILALTITSGTAAFATDLDEAEVAFESGNWRVLRSVNAMSDEVSCTGIYGKEYSIQLTAEALYLSVRGGIQGYRLRFDAEEASSMKLPSDIEKRVRAVSIDGKAFRKLLSSRRLRMEVLTLVNGIHTQDLDLSGVNKVHQSIVSGCPVSAGSSSSVEEPERKASQCPDAVEARLRERGVAEETIRYACQE